VQVQVVEPALQPLPFLGAAYSQLARGARLVNPFALDVTYPTIVFHRTTDKSNNLPAKAPLLKHVGPRLLVEQSTMTATCHSCLIGGPGGLSIREQQICHLRTKTFFSAMCACVQKSLLPTRIENRSRVVENELMHNEANGWPRHWQLGSKSPRTTLTSTET
jgi:hypothetical protein